MVDCLSVEPGNRLFGFISVGGTLGAIVGAAITATLVRKVGTINLLIISAVLLELSAQCVRFFPRTLAGPAIRKETRAEAPVGGRIWAGIVHNVRSPYLL